MRPLILIPILLLPLSACMTQRDRTIWQEFKAEISSEKAEVTPVETEAADTSEAVTPPAPVEQPQG
ncbi:hypothetical protein [Oligoflexus tunisiensis]|uniref:hypothetical protein n=1 Tax=Oligoflexus tunisiensis TaxID=708132 RepID=UPI00114C8C6C|nr:hypothetical protein [Oligoflexus tunisiensis]